MKRSAIVLFLAWFAGAATLRVTAGQNAAWAKVPEILRRIKAPEFPKRDFLVTDYQDMDESFDSTEAISNAIAACAKAGGGRVVVPAGVFLTGPVHLKSNVELHLNAGATLKFETDPKAYLPAVLTRHSSMDCWNYSPLIYAFEQENVAVTGEGTLDGQAGNQNWWEWTRNKEEEDADGRRLTQMVAENVPVQNRRFGKGFSLRPSFVEFYRCRNVLIEGVHIRRSPMWELHPTLCTNVIVRGVEIFSHGPNNDGCDPDCCKDVLIENCVFDTGDDCIAIKSGRNNDGRRLGVPSQNIIIRHCTMRDGHGGVTIGSEISGNCRNIFAEDCEMDSPNLSRVLRLKSNAVRGGIIENVFMRNVHVGRVADEVLQIDLLYFEGARGPYRPIVRSVQMENITVRDTPRVLNVAGFPGAEISGIRVCDSTFRNVREKDYISNATDVHLINCVIENAK